MHRKGRTVHYWFIIPQVISYKFLFYNYFWFAPRYVEKELADIVSEDPLTVRLRFEPAGRSVGDVGRYYQLTKENKCVVCGANDSYIRKNVVPREYRKLFPG